MRNASSWLPALAALLLSTALLCQEPPGTDDVVILCKRVLDVRGGAYIEDTGGAPVRILVSNGYIQAIQPDSVPSTARLVDLRGLTVLPGLIDAHTHLTLDLGPNARLRPATESSSFGALRGVEYAGLTLRRGFTTVRDVGSYGFADVALAHAVAQGFVRGPDIIPAAHALTITGGHSDSSGFAPGVLEKGPESGVADGATVLTAARYQLKHGAKVIKINATAGVLSLEGSVGAQQYTVEEMRVIVDEAHRHSVRVAAHAHGRAGIEAALAAGVDSLEHCHGLILGPDGREDPDGARKVLRLMKQRGTWLVPTIALTFDLDPDRDIQHPVMRAKAKFLIPLAQKTIRLAIEEGVNIAFGTDAGVLTHGKNSLELRHLVALGMTPAAAIRSATLHAAQLLALAPSTDDADNESRRHLGLRGEVRTHCRADLIAVHGDPLASIESLQCVGFVMKKGRIELPIDYPEALSSATTVVFADVRSGQEVLGRHDDFVASLSPYDRMGRCSTSKDPGPEAFLQHCREAVQPWAPRELALLRRVYHDIRAALSSTVLRLPSQIVMIKTDGSEESNKAYTRQNAIVLPQAYLDRDYTQLRHTVAHEVFHILSRYNPHRRDHWYSLLGYAPCGSIELPQNLHDARVTNPDAFHNSHVLTTPHLDREQRNVAPILFAADGYQDANWNESTFFTFVRHKFVELEKRGDTWKVKLQPDGKPVLYDPPEDLGERHHWNSNYTLHAEETIADNFVLALFGCKDDQNVQLVEQLRTSLGLSR